MERDDEDELLRKVRAQNRSVSFITGSELVNIDLGEDSYRPDEDSQLNQTVCDRKLKVRVHHFKLCIFEVQIFDEFSCFPGIAARGNIGE